MSRASGTPRGRTFERVRQGWARPDVSVLGYAIYLAFNATSLWGGVFPFFPEEFRTTQVTFTFALCQALSFLATFLIALAGSYLGSRLLRRGLEVGATVASFVGSALLIAALYLSEIQIALVVCAGACLGVGSAGFALSWQRYFSAIAPERGNYYLLLATGCGTLVYLVMYLVPIAVTVYLAPLLLVPLCGLCSVLATRTVNFHQPLFEDVPREHAREYRRVVRDHWRGAVAIGSLGFASGIARSAVMTDASSGNAMILVSMLGVLVASVIMLLIWRRGRFVLDIRTVFLVLFPVGAVCLLVYPFLVVEQTPLMAACIYTIFTFATLVMLLQCMQISRDRGMNPVFVFGFFGSIVYLMQDMGLVSGYAANMTGAAEVDLFTVALVGTFVLGMALYLLRGDVRIGSRDGHAVEKVEFVGLPGQVAAPPRALETPDDLSPAVAAEDIATNEPIEVQPVREERTDDLAARCSVLQDRYRLTNRETEIMQLFARGYSMPGIADMLVISENTVRTHAKRLYNKLDIHKRQELLALLEDDTL